MLRLRVLGSAAGGGFPQWNSHAEACRRARAGDPAALPRHQASIAVSADGLDWYVVNAAPDLRQQIAETPCLQPREGLRSTPIAGVLLTGGEVDCIAGLLTLRERQPLRLVASAAVLALLDENPVFAVLDRGLVPREAAALEARLPLRRADGRETGLFATLFPVPSKPPLYREGAEGAEGESVGLALDDGVRTLFYIPGCAAMTPDLAARLRGAGLVLFDGTLWRDDEMIRAGLGPKTGRRMGHMPVSGPGGTLEAFAALEVRQKVLIHLNNSNPLLLADSPERGIAAAAGWQVAEDGMEFQL